MYLYPVIYIIIVADKEYIEEKHYGNMYRDNMYRDNMW